MKRLDGAMRIIADNERDLAAIERKVLDQLRVTESGGLARVHRPGWLTSDDEWLDQLQSLTPEDGSLLTREWELAGGPPPGPDTSWLKVESNNEFSPAIVAVLVLFIILGIGGPLLWLVAL